MSRLDYRLRYLLQDSERRKVIETKQSRLRALLRYRGDLKNLETLGFEKTSVAGDVAAGFVTLEALERLANDPNVISIESSRPLKKELDTTAIEVDVVSLREKLDQRNIPCRGSGVIVGVVDSGFDFTHPCFLDNGQTRILAFWDQNQDASEIAPTGFNYAPPQGFGYGVEYGQELIDAALQSADPLQVIPHARQNHGTRVASIAAGNGAQSPPPNQFIGMAPKADLIFVSYNAEGQLGDSAFALDAINYIIEKARDYDKPVVINVSQGDNFGPHDGTSLLERAIENQLSQPGVAIVKSAGDEADAQRHASGQVLQGQEFQIEFEITANHEEDTFDIWYETRDRFDVLIESPNGTRTAPVAPETEVQLQLANGNEVYICSQLNHPDNHDNRINIILGNGANGTIEHGKWKLVLMGTNAEYGGVHVWIDKTSNHATFTSPDRYWTVTIPGTSTRVITVGGYISKGNFNGVGDLLPASSPGPTRDGRTKPEITAPGFDLTTAVALDASGVLYRGQPPGNSGTSFSAPHVSGVIALLFEKNRDLTQDDIRNILFDSADQDDFTGIVPNVNWGYGKLNAESAYDALSEWENA